MQSFWQRPLLLPLLLLHCIIFSSSSNKHAFIPGTLALQLNYDDEFVYPAKADQLAITELLVGNAATVQWKSTQPVGMQASLWLTRATTTSEMSSSCPYSSSVQCVKIADFQIGEGTRKKFEWKVSRLGMSFTDLYYFRIFYNTSSPSLGVDSYIQSGYMTIRVSGETISGSNGNSTIGGTMVSLSPDATATSTAGNSQSSAAATEESGSAHLSLIIGAAVGIPLALLALVVLLAIILHHKRKMARLVLMSSSSSSSAVAATAAVEGDTLSMSRSRSELAASDKAILLESQTPPAMLDGYPTVSREHVSHELSGDTAHSKIR